MSAVELFARQQLLSVALIPAPLVAGLSVAVALAQWRVPSFVAVVVFIGAAGNMRSFGGGRGLTVGRGLFTGYFVGFTLGSQISTAQLGWSIAEIGLGVVVATFVKLALFGPHLKATVRRLLRSVEGGARRILLLAESIVLSGDRGKDVR